MKSRCSQGCPAFWRLWQRICFFVLFYLFPFQVSGGHSLGHGPLPPYSKPVMSHLSDSSSIVSALPDHRWERFCTFKNQCDLFSFQFSSVAQSCPTLCDPMNRSMPGLPVHHQLLESQWCRLTISSSVVPFSSGPQSFPASGSFPMSQLFASGGQRIGVSASASVLPMNMQDRFPLGWIFVYV